MEVFIGVDVGGTNVKFGLVESSGKLLEKEKTPTRTLAENGPFVENFLDALGEQLNAHPEVKKVGLGIPGTLSKDRRSTLELPNIPGLNNIPLYDKLKARFPDIHFHLENDANAAALGEFYFGHENSGDDFLLVTLGTGIGGAAVIDRNLVIGAGGNGMEIGHIITSNGKTLEQAIGKKGQVALAKKLLKQKGKHSALKKEDKLDAKKIQKAAVKGDELAGEVFIELGHYLGEGIVTALRLLDIKTVLIGGGVADTFPLFIGPVKEKVREFLPPYYIKNLEIRQATLANNAGIIGAASLCFMDQ